MAASDKKINVVSQFWPPDFVGGGEISTHIICQELVKNGYKVTILTPNVPRHKDKRFKYLPLHNPPNLLEPFERKYFSKISWKGNLPEGVYWGSDFYGAAFLSDKNIKKVVTVRDYWPVCSCGDALTKNLEFCYERDLKSILNCKKIAESRPFRKIPRIIRYLHNSSFRRTIISKFNHVVFISNFVKDKITSDIHLNKYSVIYNPLPQNYLDKKITQKQIYNNILFAGAVIRHKGPSVIINAFKEIIKLNPRITLTIAGEIYGENKTLLNELSHLKNIRVIGKIPHEKMIEFYDVSDIVVCPSLWNEPFGRSLIEGMARNCVPIATNQGGPTEIIQNGKTGFLFEVGNYEQLEKVILNLYQKSTIMKTIQEKAQNLAIKKFSPDKIAQQYEKILNAI